jgi:hypothetical protein
MDYTVTRIDGDYAYLQLVNDLDAEPKCVARALLPDSVGEGTRLAYEMMQYRVSQEQ